MSRARKSQEPPAWLVEGARVDYSAVIGGPPTKFDLVVRAGPQLVCGTWCVWLTGIAGCVAVDACRPAAPAAKECAGG